MEFTPYSQKVVMISICLCRGGQGRFAEGGEWVAGIINFVLSLEKNHYLYQFGQFAWTHMILLVVFIPTSFFVSNIFDGLIWFLLPCALVIINDISAYLTGAPLFPREQLALSQSKHVFDGRASDKPSQHVYDNVACAIARPTQLTNVRPGSLSIELHPEVRAYLRIEALVDMSHAGFFVGRTPLIKLSPKKTWEGFIGGLLLTLVASWYLARFMSRFPWMVCERIVRTGLNSLYSTLYSVLLFYSRMTARSCTATLDRCYVCN